MTRKQAIEIFIGGTLSGVFAVIIINMAPIDRIFGGDTLWETLLPWALLALVWVALLVGLRRRRQEKDPR